jgi:GDP-L-fucose synthase
LIRVIEGSRILVTGGHGFIGARVVRLLAATGADVVAPHRPDTDPMEGLPGDHPAIDLEDGAHLDDLMKGVDAVVHLAARSGGIQFQETRQTDVFEDNHKMTRTVLEAAVRATVGRVFLASSAVVYGRRAGALISEDDPFVAPGVDRVSGYAWSKLTDEVMGEWYRDAAGLRVVVGRFANVYGPGGSFDEARSTVLHALVRRAVEAGTGGTLHVWGDGTAVRSFVHVDDAARAVLSILAAGTSGQAYNIDASVPISVAELAELVRAAVDPSLKVRFLPDKPQGVARRVLDTSRLRSLGWEPRIELAQGIPATVEAFRAGG